MLGYEKNWTAVEAKSKFAELINEAKRQPQIITNHGKPVAILVSIKEWKNKLRKTEDLVTFFRNSPLCGEKLDLNRIEDNCKDIKF